MRNYFKKFITMFLMLLAVLGFGAIQNGTVANADTGWTTYGKTSKYIIYKGHWPVTTQANYHDAYTANKSDKLEFSFIGTKLRYYSLGYNNHTNKANINIDGKDYSFVQSKNQAVDYCLDFEINNLENKTHNVVVSKSDDLVLSFQAIAIDSTGSLTQFIESIKLDKSFMDLAEGDSAELTATTTPQALGVIWKSSDPSIATVDNNGKVTAIKAGQATITATINDGNNISASCLVTVTSPKVILNIEPEKNNIHLNETVAANLTIDNIKEIAAEDVRIKYDNTKLKFLGMDEVDGIKLVKSEGKDGELRLILASKGLANVVQAKKALLKLNFQGIATGEALVDVTKGRVSDGIEMEKDLTDAECGQATIIIDNIEFKDVNNTGEFTLLDLAIDARHLGEDPKTLSEYNTDQVLNGAIDDDDLTQIGKYMLENVNYSFNQE